MTPDLLTISSIKRGGWDNLNTTPTRLVWMCGCDRSIRDGRWRLCQYHQGFDDGVEAARR